MLSIANHKRSFFPRRLRRGVSLLEVLISIFVLTVGLLGVAALIPVGRHHMAEAIRTDRAATCGRAILHEAKVRQWLDPATWCTRSGGSIVVTGMVGLVERRGILPRTYVIDPWFLANNSADSKADDFPYDSSSSGIDRVTLVSVYNSDSAVHLANAQRLCLWNDDLMFAPSPDDPDGRPHAMVLTSDTSPPSVSLWTNGMNVLRDESEGNYSWLLTVTPIGETVTIAGNNYVDIDRSLSCQVSVVVFFKRDLVPSTWGDTLAERMASSLTGGGIGGGDVVLGDANVKEDDWVLVGDSGYPYEWYRVVAAEDEGAATRNITLAGPDWRSYAARVAVLSDVIGVYTAIYPVETRR